jgi:DNA repair protein RAD16
MFQELMYDKEGVAIHNTCPRSTQCDCTSTSWDFSDYKNCDHCGHKPMAHFCWWNKEILKPIQKYGSVGEGRIGFIKVSLYYTILYVRAGLV